MTAVGSTSLLSSSDLVFNGRILETANNTGTQILCGVNYAEIFMSTIGFRLGLFSSFEILFDFSSQYRQIQLGYRLNV